MWHFHRDLSCHGFPNDPFPPLYLNMTTRLSPTHVVIVIFALVVSGLLTLLVIVIVGQRSKRRLRMEEGLSSMDKAFVHNSKPASREVSGSFNVPPPPQESPKAEPEAALAHPEVLGNRGSSSESPVSHPVRIDTQSLVYSIEAQTKSPSGDSRLSLTKESRHTRNASNSSNRVVLDSQSRIVQSPVHGLSPSHAISLPIIDGGSSLHSEITFTSDNSYNYWSLGTKPVTSVPKHMNNERGRISESIQSIKLYPTTQYDPATPAQEFPKTELSVPPVVHTVSYQDDGFSPELAEYYRKSAWSKVQRVYESQKNDAEVHFT